MSITILKIDNFWNRLRVERNIRYKDLAELYHMSESTFGAYFSGQTMPSDTIIHNLCDLFDVDFAVGKEEFAKAHETWETSCHRCKGMLAVGVPNSTAKEGELALAVTGEVENVNKVEPVDIFSLIYGKIPYDLFMKFLDIVASRQGDPLKIIYGNVTYSEFKQIADIIGNVNAD